MRWRSLDGAVYVDQRTRTGEPVRSWVYVIEAERGLKIGFTADPARRIPALERQHGDIYVWALVPGSRLTERWLHRRYAELNIGGEWFRWSDDLITACENETLLEITGGLCKFRRPNHSANAPHGGSVTE